MILLSVCFLWLYLAIVKKDNDTVTDYAEYINNYRDGYWWKARTETFFINGEPVEVSLPEGYGIVPIYKSQLYIRSYILNLRIYCHGEPIY